MPQTITDKSLLVENLFAAKREKQKKLAEMRAKELESKLKKKKKFSSRRTKIPKKRIKVDFGRMNRQIFGGAFNNA